MAITKSEFVHLSGSTAYADLTIAAHRRFLRAKASTVSGLRRSYHRAAEDIRFEIERVTSGPLRPRHLRVLATRLETRTRKLSTEVLETTTKGISQSAEAGVSAPQNIAANLLVGGWVVAAGTRILPPFRDAVAQTFASAKDKAVLRVLTRTRRDRLRFSDRIWRVGENAREALTRLIEDGVARGLDSRKLAREVQQYLQPGKFTAMKQETRQRPGVSKDIS